MTIKRKSRLGTGLSNICKKTGLSNIFNKLTGNRLLMVASLASAFVIASVAAPVLGVIPVIGLPFALAGSATSLMSPLLGISATVAAVTWPIAFLRK